MGKITDFINRLKSVKHIELMVGGLALSLVLVIYFSCVSCSADSTSTSSNAVGSDYCTAMQIKLEQTVSEISGVGNASVVVNWDKSVTSSIMSAATENPKATGALIVCDGGNSAKVKIDIIFAVSTLLDLPIDKIAVYPKQN